MQLLQNIATIFIVVYAATLIIKVARHIYLYLSMYNNVRDILRVVHRIDTDRLPVIVACLLAAEVLVLVFLHPIGLYKCGVKWVLYPIDLSGSTVDVKRLVDDLLKLV